MRTLYTGPLSMFGAKAEIALREKGIAFDRVLVPFDADDRYRPTHPVVQHIHPKAQVPVLVDGALALFDSTQIFEYLEDRQPRPALWPADVTARAIARQVEVISDEVFFPEVVRLFGLQDAMESDAARAACARCAEVYRRFEARLADADFLAGHYGYADIAFYMAHLFAERKGAGLDAAMVRLHAWRERVGARPAVRAVVGPMMRFLARHGRPVPPYLQSHLTTPDD